MVVDITTVIMSLPLWTFKNLIAEILVLFPLILPDQLTATHVS